ncbi:MAG: hypothetical protein LBQ43_04480, partial [Holosporales bacterium]|nr:hypothetical protein [Holosporales bacterium]
MFCCFTKSLIIGFLASPCIQLHSMYSEGTSYVKQTPQRLPLNAASKHPEYTCLNPSIYRRRAIPHATTSIIRMVTTDAEIALKRHDRDEFLYMANFLFEALVLGNDLSKEATNNLRVHDYGDGQASWDITKSHAACLIQLAIPPELIAITMQQELQISKDVLLEHRTLLDACVAKVENLQSNNVPDDQLGNEYAELYTLSEQQCELEQRLSAFIQDQDEWYVRFKVAQRVNSIWFHQHVQKILTIRDDIASLDSFSHHIKEYANNPIVWVCANQDNYRLMKALDITLSASETIRSPETWSKDHLETALNVHLKTALSKRNDDLNEITFHKDLVDTIARELNIDREDVTRLERVASITRSMFAIEFQHFIGYLIDLAALLETKVNMRAIDCGMTDATSLFTCGLNSLLIKDTAKKNVISNRTDSCDIIRMKKKEDPEFRANLHAALSGRKLKYFRNGSVAFESSGTTGSYENDASTLLSRPCEDWIALHGTDKVAFPGAVQADILELAAFAHCYNLI